MLKRSFSLLLALCLILGVFPVPARALNLDDYDFEAVVRDDIVYYETVAEAAQVVKEYMKRRIREFKVGFQTTDGFTMGALAGNGILNLAAAHSGVYNEGDYLKWDGSSCTEEGCGASWRVTGTDQDGVYYLVIHYTLFSDVNAEKEANLDAEENKLLEKLGVASMTSDYQKVKAIYDWVCANVSYDYSYYRHSAYHAMIERTAVCEGYALLMYRLLLKAGIDNRMVAGGNHAWNIVKLGDAYYNLDATWDAGTMAPWGSGEYDYFLRCEANFSGHTREYGYDNEDFHAKYPMSLVDYDPAWENCKHANVVETPRVEPTCFMKDGMTAGTQCADCGAPLSGRHQIPGLWHDWKEEGTPATCTEPGHMNYRCARCGITDEADLDPKGHKYEETEVEAGCGQEGCTLYTCTACGDTYKENITPALSDGHQYQEKVHEATCTNEGKAVRICKFCRDIQVEILEEPLGHEVRGWTRSNDEHWKECENCPTIIVEPEPHQFVDGICSGCGINDGYRDQCGYCGATERTVIPAVEPTCTETGLTRGFACAQCDRLLMGRLEISALGHDYEEKRFFPNCEDQGCTLYTCTTCGDSYKDNVVDALGGTHQYCSVTHSATCEKGSYESVFCLNCSISHVDNETAATGHTYDDAGLCTVCGAEKPQILLGDADGSGTVDFFDGMYVLQYYAGLLDESQLNAAASDVDNSGTIDFFDGMYILQYYAGVLAQLPV